MRFILFFILAISLNAEFNGMVLNMNEVFKTITVNKMQYKVIRLTKLEKEVCDSKEVIKIKFKDIRIGDLVEGKLNYNQGLSTISYMKIKCNKELAF